jgi:hypothetical protein
LKINAASEPRNFKLLHALKLEFLGFNLPPPPLSIAALKPKFLGSGAALKVKRILIFFEMSQK